MISHTKTHHKRADIQQFPSQSGEGTSDFNDLHVMDTLKPRAPGVVIAVGIAYTHPHRIITGKALYSDYQRRTRNTPFPAHQPRPSFNIDSSCRHNLGET